LAPDWEKQKLKKAPSIALNSISSSLQSQNSLPRMTSFFGGFMSPRKVNQSIQEVETISKIKVQNILPTENKINSVCVHPTGTFFVTADDQEIRVWDYETGAVDDKIDSPGSLVVCNKEMIVFCHQKRVQMYTIEVCEKISEFEVEEEITALALTKDSKKLICGFKNGKIRLHDLQDPSSYKNFGKHGDCVNCVLASNDGNFVFSGSSDSTIKIWGIDGTDLQTLKGHHDSVTCLTATKNCKTLISGSVDRGIRVWSIETLKCIKVMNKVHSHSVTSLVITPNESHVISASQESNYVKIHKIDSGSEKLSVSVGKKETNSCLAVDPFGKYFVTGTEIGVAVWQNVKYLNVEENQKNKSFKK
jgi:WD40 repeat protein